MRSHVPIASLRQTTCRPCSFDWAKIDRAPARVCSLVRRNGFAEWVDSISLFARGDLKITTYDYARNNRSRSSRWAGGRHFFYINGIRLQRTQGAAIENREYFERMRRSGAIVRNGGGLSRLRTIPMSNKHALRPHQPHINDGKSLLPHDR